MPAFPPTEHLLHAANTTAKVQATRRRLCGLLVGSPIALLAAPSPCTATVLREDVPPPYIPTPQQVVDRMLEMASVTKQDFVIDLGCGDGRHVITAARRFGARGLGIEIDAQLVAQARQLASKAGVANLTQFDVQDALATNLAEATVLTLYLGPDLNEKLMPRILQTMRPGARVVSHDFPLGLWQPDRAERFEVPEKNFGRGGESTVMLWIVPARIHGLWRAQIGGAGASRTEEISIVQSFQKFEAAVHRKANDSAATDTRIDGDRIAFTLPPDAARAAGQRVHARVEGDVMTGTLRTASPANDQALPFTAKRIDGRPRVSR